MINILKRACIHAGGLKYLTGVFLRKMQKYIILVQTLPVQNILTISGKKKTSAYSEDGWQGLVLIKSLMICI